jgi:hypothetical protein
VIIEYDVGDSDVELHASVRPGQVRMSLIDVLGKAEIIALQFSVRELLKLIMQSQARFKLLLERLQEGEEISVQDLQVWHPAET